MSEDDRRAVRDGYDELADAYDAERSLDSRERAILDEFHAELPGEARVLDAGCGAGVPGGAAAGDGRTVVGLDVSRRQLALAADRRPDWTLAQGDMTALPFAADSFDALCALYSVVHVPRERHAETFAEFARVLRSGALALLTVGAGEWTGRNQDWLGTGVEMRWSVPGPERASRLLSEAGFAVEERHGVRDALGDDSGEAVFLGARLQ